MIDFPPYRNLLLAGLVGELSFEAYAWLVSPLIFGLQLEPANLIIGLGKTFLGVNLPYWAGFAVHFLIGSIGFAAVVWLTHVLTKTRLAVSGAIAGAALWFVAQGLLAPLMGRSFMMGFGVYTQSSLLAHVGMSLMIALTLAQLTRQKPLPA